MIPGTSYSPAKAFISFAREFFEAIAIEDYQAALGGLDMSLECWSRKDLLARLNDVIGSEQICSAVSFTKSASPEVEKTQSGYLLRHRLPVKGK